MTGTAGTGFETATLGWFIGIGSMPSGDSFFATRITGGENPSGRTARKITEAILAMLKFFPHMSEVPGQSLSFGGFRLHRTF